MRERNSNVLRWQLIIGSLGSVFWKAYKLLERVKIEDWIRGLTRDVTTELDDRQTEGGKGKGKNPAMGRGVECSLIVIPRFGASATLLG